MFTNNLIKEYKIKFNITIDDDDKVVWLNHIIIPKKHRRKQLGTTILKEFVKWLDENHYNSYLLVANCYGTSEEVLVKFYSKFGYNITDEYKWKNNIYMKRQKY